MCSPSTNFTNYNIKKSSIFFQKKKSCDKIWKFNLLFFKNKHNLANILQLKSPVKIFRLVLRTELVIGFCEIKIAILAVKQKIL